MISPYYEHHFPFDLIYRLASTYKYAVRDFDPNIGYPPIDGIVSEGDWHTELFPLKELSWYFKYPFLSDYLRLPLFQHRKGNLIRSAISGTISWFLGMEASADCKAFFSPENWWDGSEALNLSLSGVAVHQDKGTVEETERKPFVSIGVQGIRGISS